jgi:hypothetical protein
MPGVDWTGQLVFYEDFPYAWWNQFNNLDDLPEGAFAGIPEGTYLTPRYADISDQLERKVRGISMYESQMERLFGSVKSMGAAVRQHAAAVAAVGRAGGAAERYWHSYAP